jgi:hypothetical protein
MLVAPLAGCGAGAVDTPADAQRVESGWVRVDLPKGWVRGDPLSEVWTETYQDAAGHDAAAQLALSPRYGSFTASMAVARATAMLQVSGYADFRRLDSLPSAETSTRLRDHIAFTYTGDDGEAYEGVLWAAADEERHAVLVQLTGRDLDDALVAQVDTSLQVEADE